MTALQGVIEHTHTIHSHSQTYENLRVSNKPKHACFQVLLAAPFPSFLFFSILAVTCKDGYSVSIKGELSGISHRAQGWSRAGVIMFAALFLCVCAMPPIIERDAVSYRANKGAVIDVHTLTRLLVRRDSSGAGPAIDWSSGALCGDEVRQQWAVTHSLR